MCQEIKIWKQKRVNGQYIYVFFIFGNFAFKKRILMQLTRAKHPINWRKEKFVILYWMFTTFFKKKNLILYLPENT